MMMLRDPRELQTITDKLEYLKRLIEQAEQALRPRPILRIIEGGKRG
jgi:hypothetical protein